MESISPPAAFDLTPLATLLSAPATGGPYYEVWGQRRLGDQSLDPDELLGRHEERREQDATIHP